MGNFQLDGRQIVNSVGSWQNRANSAPQCLSSSPRACRHMIRIKQMLALYTNLK